MKVFMKLFVSIIDLYLENDKTVILIKSVYQYIQEAVKNMENIM